jgi:hypothetical protein
MREEIDVLDASRFCRVFYEAALGYLATVATRARVDCRQV